MILRRIFLMFCAMGFLSTSASAQLYLENAKVNLSAAPGDHVNGFLTLRNTSSRSINIKVYWEDFAYKDPYDGTKIFAPAGTMPRSASRWVAFSPQEFNLRDNGQQTVNYTVSVPHDIHGGYYGVLFFETFIGSPNGTGITIVSRVGCLFFIESKNKNKKGVLKDAEIKGGRLEVLFVNGGDVVLIPHTTYYVMQEGGMVQSRGEIKNVYVPPGAVASLKAPLDKNLKQGRYTMVINSDLEEGDVVVKEVNFVKGASDQFSIESVKD